MLEHLRDAGAHALAIGGVLRDQVNILAPLGTVKHLANDLLGPGVLVDLRRIDVANTRIDQSRPARSWETEPSSFPCQESSPSDRSGPVSRSERWIGLASVRQPCWPARRPEFPWHRRWRRLSRSASGLIRHRKTVCAGSLMVRPSRLTRQTRCDISDPSPRVGEPAL